jgi:O-antigen ligase
MNVLAQSEPATNPRRDGLTSLATSLLVLMPLVVWVANRAAPLVLSLCALLLLAASWSGGRLPHDLARLRDRLTSRTGLALLAFLGFALFSILWSHQPWRSLRVFGELLVPLVAGGLVALLWPGQSRRGTRSRIALMLMACALMLACGLVIIELRTGMALRNALGMKSFSYIFNPVMISYLLLGFPVLDGLWRTQDGLARGLAVALAGVLAFAIIASESGAAVFGLIIGILAWLSARVLPRLTVCALTAGFVAFLALAPVMGEILDDALPPAAHEGMKNAHSRDRVDIWLSFGEAVRARPLTGAGFGTSAVYDSHPVALEVSAKRRVLLGVGHPHSLPVQIWAEMGVIGALLAALVFLGVMAKLARFKPERRAAPLAMVATALAIATVGHGAWQAWWVAAIAASACWFLHAGLSQMDNQS